MVSIGDNHLSERKISDEGNELHVGFITLLPVLERIHVVRLGDLSDLRVFAQSWDA
jgi:hypothetical protein